MHEFRVLAPMPLPLAGLPGARERDPAADVAFWTRIHEACRGTDWEMPRARRSDGGLTYTKAAGDDLPRPLELVTGSSEPIDLVEQMPDAGLRCTALHWSVFDHGVALVEAVLQADELPGESAGQAADRLEQQVQDVTVELATRCVHPDLHRLLTVIDADPSAAQHIEREGVDLEASSRERSETDPTELPGPLWVARALMLPAEDTGQDDFARAWLAGVDGDPAQYLRELRAGERSNVTEWLNYVHIEDASTPVLWEALRRAQYFYTAMTEVDTELREILSWSMAERSEVSLTALREQLESSMNRAQELLLVRAEVGKYASRIGRTEMKRILASWDHDEILEEPVRDKLRICRERLEALASDRAARSAMFTDIILMTIGVTSVLATAIALVQFGRDASADPGQSAFDLGRSRITYWFSAQSIDTIVLVSALVSLVLVIVFVWKRRQSIS